MKLIEEPPRESQHAVWKILLYDVYAKVELVSCKVYELSICIETMLNCSSVCLK